jgi:hypothetical protein
MKIRLFLNRPGCVRDEPARRRVGISEAAPAVIAWKIDRKGEQGQNGWLVA